MKFIGPFVLFIGIGGLAFSMYEFLTLEFFEEPKYFWNIKSRFRNFCEIFFMP